MATLDTPLDTVEERTVDYADVMNLEQLVGNVYPALPSAELPSPDQGGELAERIGGAVGPYAPVTEQVRVTLLDDRVE